MFMAASPVRHSVSFGSSCAASFNDPARVSFMWRFWIGSSIQPDRHLDDSAGRLRCRLCEAHRLPLDRARPQPLLASPPVRGVFYAYLTVIVTGLVYFSIIGLTHH
jgi:hypothetical protein